MCNSVLFQLSFNGSGESALFVLSVVMAKSVARFTPFARGRIVGKAEEGASRRRIRKEVLKKDGQRATLQSIGGVLSHARADPAWQGRDSAAGGRPQELDDAEVRKLKKLVHDEVGLAKLNMPYLKKRLPFLRRVSKECPRQALKRLGFAWRLRRAKAAIGKKYKPGRLDWSDWVRKQPQKDLNRYAYVDGTGFYLARTPEEKEDKGRACLGKYCYRLSTGQDSLEQGCC